MVPADLGRDDSTIAVFDNGVGMDGNGLKVHWIVGDSIKSRNRNTAGGRRTIGKFGIGKLAAYVLGDRLTHITKAKGKYYSTTMDFASIPTTVDVDKVAVGTVERSAPVTLDLRTLTAAQAKEALAPWIAGEDGLTDLKLFGKGAEESWTVAVISDLKPMAIDLSPNMLRWVLSTAMPLRDDFALYLNGAQVESSKLKVKRVDQWILGKDLKKLPRPAPGELEVSTDQDVPKPGYAHWMIIDQLLGPITGYVEVFEDPIDTGKSDRVVGRSNGFFIHVHGRLVNPFDAGFGINRNQLRHGTFSRIRVVANIDRLDSELRSSRENLRDGPMLIRAREILQGLFNFARTKLEAHQVAVTTERRATQRLLDSPASLSERPILQLMLDAFDGSYVPRHLVPVPTGVFADEAALREHVEARIKSGKGLIADIVFADLGTHEPMAVLDGMHGVLSINLEHPFVAHFVAEFEDSKRNLPLQLFSMSEILLEAQLHGAGIGEDAVNDVLDSRDELLRHLALSSGAENSLTVSQHLIASASSANDLEEAVVQAFRQLGYEAIPKGGKDEPDGLAEAFLAGGDAGAHHYRVSLEAKSKQAPGSKVKKKDVEVSTIARHRSEANCDHAIVIGPGFETGPDDTGAVIREIEEDRKNHPGKTITLMRIDDLARLVRIAPLKRVNLEELRDLFTSATSPDDAAAWVEELSNKSVEPGPYKAILEEVWAIQKEDKEHSVDFGSLRTALRRSEVLTISAEELQRECNALSRMAPNVFIARKDRVELNIHPKKVLEIIHQYVENAGAKDES